MDYWARVLGSFSLLIATISMYLSWRTYKRDRSDIRVSLTYEMKTGLGPAFNVKIVNHGRRIARVEKVEVQFPTSAPLVKVYSSGIEVDETEPLNVLLHIYTRINEEETEIPIKFIRAEVIDTLGNVYKYPGLSIFKRIEYHRLKKEVKEIWKEQKKFF